MGQTLFLRILRVKNVHLWSDTAVHYLFWNTFSRTFINHWFIQHWICKQDLTEMWLNGLIIEYELNAFQVVGKKKILDEWYAYKYAQWIQVRAYTVYITYAFYAETQFCLSACCMYLSDWIVSSINFPLLKTWLIMKMSSSLLVSSQSIIYCDCTPYDTELYILNS